MSRWVLLFIIIGLLVCAPGLARGQEVPPVEPERVGEAVEEVFSEDLRVGEWLATGGEERQRLQQ